MDGEQGLGLGDGTGVFQDIPTSTPWPTNSRSPGPVRTRRPRPRRPAAPAREQPASTARTLQRLEQAPAELRCREGAARTGSSADPEGHAAASARACSRTSPSDVRTPGRAGPPPLGGVRRALGCDAPLGLRRHGAVGPPPVDHERPRGTAADGRDGAGVRLTIGRRPRCRRRGGRGRRRACAPRRHVVLDGDGGRWVPDEAHRPRAAHPRQHPFPAGTTCSSSRSAARPR